MVRAAVLVSNVTSPTLLMALLSPLVGGLATRSAAGVGWGVLGTVSTAVIPAAIVHLGVRRGRYGDHHLARREQRAVPMALAMLSVSSGVAALAVLGAPGAIVALQVAVLATLLVATVVTLRWKVSLHLAVVCASATALTIVGRGWWALAWLVAPAVARARLRLTAHTPAQVVAGAVLGTVITGAVLGIAEV